MGGGPGAGVCSPLLGDVSRKVFGANETSETGSASSEFGVGGRWLWVSMSMLKSRLDRVVVVRTNLMELDVPLVGPYADAVILSHGVRT